jgi:hypothetical protein
MLAYPLAKLNFSVLYDTAALLQEANHAFELNIRLFSSFSEEEDSAAQELLVPQDLNVARIPSPSLEGYAKAAAYMTKDKLSPTVQKKRGVQEIPAGTPSAATAASGEQSLSSATTDGANSIQLLFFVALLLPATFVIRSLLKSVLLA